MTSTEVAIRPGAAPSMPSPTEWKGIVAQAETLAQTQIVPREFRTKPHDIIAVSLIGREMGLSPMLSMQYIHVIEGKPSVKPELMNARIRAAGHRIEVEAWDTERCRLTGIRKDGERMTVEFTMDDARRAGLVKEKGNWDKYPKAMLWARALGMLARALFPDVIIGASYTPEELGAQVDDEGNPLDADAPSSVLTDEQRAQATHAAENIEDAEVVEDADVSIEEPDDEYVTPAPPPPPTAEELHERACRYLFGKGWPMGNCKGEDPMDPDAVDDGSLRYFAENADVNHERYGKKNREQRDWVLAELKRRQGPKPTAEEIRAAAQQPQSGTTHDAMNAEAAERAARDDEYADIPFDAKGNPVPVAETATTSPDFAPTAATPEFPPRMPDVNNPVDQLDQPLSDGWRNLMHEAMVKYGFAANLEDARGRVEAWKSSKESDGSVVTNAMVRGQVQAFKANAPAAT